MMSSMKKIIMILAFLGSFSFASAQSKTTREFSEDHEGAFTLFFYNNTLKMLNQDDNPELEELIKDIDKMKFIRIEKAKSKFTDEDFKDLIEDYHDEDFEDLMTLRHSGMKVNVYIQEEDDNTTGLVLLMDDDTSFSVLDIKGKVPLNKLASLINKVQSID